MIRAPVLALAMAAAAWAGPATAGTSPPQNVLNLSATGTVEAPLDLITISLATLREGPDAATVQAQLKAALEAALAEARKSAQPGRMDVRTGVFSVGPRHTQTGKVEGWRGTAELLLEGRDFARITQAAGRMPGMAVSHVSFGLSREARARVEGDAQHLAIERFKSKAGELARSFGFSGYTLREVTVTSNDDMHSPRPVATARMASAEAAPVPAEAGKSAVTVSVSGSVQLR